MWPFRKKEINGPQNAGFEDTPMGVVYRGVHEQKRMPDPGAQAYAWETLALPAYTPIGPGNHAISFRAMPLGPPPLMTQQGAIVRGIPTTAGQIIGQPLINDLTPVGGQV